MSWDHRPPVSGGAAQNVHLPTAGLEPGVPGARNDGQTGRSHRSHRAVPRGPPRRTRPGCSPPGLWVHGAHCHRLSKPPPSQQYRNATRGPRPKWGSKAFGGTAGKWREGAVEGEVLRPAQGRGCAGAGVSCQGRPRAVQSPGRGAPALGRSNQVPWRQPARASPEATVTEMGNGATAKDGRDAGGPSPRARAGTNGCRRCSPHWLVFTETRRTMQKVKNDGKTKLNECEIT